MEEDLTQLPPLVLKRNEERRLKAGHVWVYSNEIDTAKTPLKAFSAGQLVNVKSTGGESLGVAYVNPGTLISARLLVRNKRNIDLHRLLRRRLETALELRTALYDGNSYRLVFGESDGLPGLVVDRYDDYLVAQAATAGMDVMRDQITDALVTLLSPGGIVWRNDGAMRELEGLSKEVTVAHGDVPEHVTVVEGGARFKAPLLSGQKTGWYFDQSENRRRVARYTPGRRVLDVCSYLGAWGVQAALNGAAETTCVDASETALEGVFENARMNGVEIQTRHGDAFEALKELQNEQRQFDLVILDPPAFVKRKKDIKQGALAYRRLNDMALRLISNGGYLVSCSCSFHISNAELLREVQRAAARQKLRLQLLETGGQGPDHPVHPMIPETAYLKALFFRVLRG